MNARMKLLPWLLGSTLMVVLIAMPAASAAQATVGYGIAASGLKAGQDYVAGQVIVGLRPGESFRVPPQAKVVGQLPGTALLLEFSGEGMALQAIPGLLASPHVSFVERNGFLSIPPLAPSRQKDSRWPHVSDPLTAAQAEAEKPIEPQAVSGDPATRYQWHHRVIRKTASLGTLSTTPPTIAIIDTGVDYSHSDLAGKVIRGKNCIHDNFDPFDDHGHGTHVAGLAAATTAKPPSPPAASATIQVRNGTTELGSGTKDRGGGYSALGSAIAGTGRNLFLTGMTGYLNDTMRQPLTVLSGTPSGPLTDAISKSRPTGYFHGTIDWKTAQPLSAGAGANSLGWDLDLGIRLSDGTLFSYGPVGGLSAPPFVFLPRDSFSDLEPVESFVIGPSAADGTYKLAVARFSGPSGLRLNESRAQVQFFNASARVLFLNAPACAAAKPVWHVADVVKSGTSYTVTRVNACATSFPE